MPIIAPMMKVNNCKQYGAIVISHGQDLSESKATAMKLGKMFELMYINGYVLKKYN
jgi:threonine dehydratase